MKLSIRYQSLDWWIWLLIWIGIGVGLAGIPEGYFAAVALSAVNLVYAIAKDKSLVSFPVQVREVWLVLIAAALWPPLWWLFIALFIGDFIYVLFDRCGIARTLILMPWNKNETLR